MRKGLRVVIGALALVACVLGITALMSPSTEAQPPGQFCGGFAGIPCPEGFVCVDVPGDHCNPSQGGADCAGYCKKSH